MDLVEETAAYLDAPPHEARHSIAPSASPMRREHAPHHRLMQLASWLLCIARSRKAKMNAGPGNARRTKVKLSAADPVPGTSSRLPSQLQD